MRVGNLDQIGKENMANLNELDIAAPPGAFSTFDAEVLVPEVENIPEGGCYVEVGVDKGKSLYIARQVAKPSVKVCGVDLREDPKVTGAIFTQGDSVEISKQFKDEIDVLFIDGDHSYEGCKRDIDAWYPFVKKDGVMLFHDGDESSPGVVRAVAEFVNTYKGTLKKWTIHKRTDKNTSMISIEL